VPVHRRRAGERPRLIQARVAASPVHQFCFAVLPGA
jgi:hypothetical protein